MSPKSLANPSRQAGESDWDNFTELDPLSRTDPVAASLPPAGVNRWVARRKAAVVAAVRSGAIGLEDACRRYELSEEEFHAWERGIESHGIAGLRSTRLQIYRDRRLPTRRSNSIDHPVATDPTYLEKPR